MTQFRVHFEASAAIGIEIAVEAEDEDDAQRIAQRMYDKGELMLTDVVSNLIKPDPAAVAGYAEGSGKPFTYMTLEEDENGFEIVDVFFKESDG
ncbi:MAG: hypothetical protein E5V72_25255 [Mesorhizobium sp.]|uniref:hypothetical protein n=1 Tax=Mesorhizobium sp. TaxID=1871066 RepID=UPI000FE7BF93|nr:hypothetical protein [Mesorhizobium sp.]RWH50254.1 MAG: hypothetical protein EOQ80_04595 [Mesorhizobium sp.]RWH52280.1 MAG: hypothetical protein EOQ82_26650 [Mesorhizobium sp.]RWI69687.1 MAG: hypothetical protein EOR18_20885 [Mesorhizobium sp.]RWI76154.1 MAG: hypothetical protein EOR19_18475 [Mesorhizobium sp.]RWJ33224.1 MAG: hypothetical protein EOR28_11605 [Mesorhizobium sp.]